MANKKHDLEFNNIINRSIDQNSINNILDFAIELDGKRDITSEALNISLDIKGSIYNSKECYVSGIDEAKYIFQKANVEFISFVTNGQKIKKNTKVATILGNANEIFKRIRTALDVLMLMSGITSSTREFYSKVGNKITALRKVHPCLGLLEKKAVAVGNGNTHRLNLSDGYLIKPFYVEALAHEKGLSYEDALVLAIQRCKAHREENNNNFFIEVEARNEKEAFIAAKNQIEIVMLDNFKPKEAISLSKKLKERFKDLRIEISGGINLKNCSNYNTYSIDYISTSRITFYAQPIDMYFCLEP
ncbi:MAG: hypothetical protein QXO21_04015 [Candidatus Anstonellales archaeon]